MRCRLQNLSLILGIAVWAMMFHAADADVAVTTLTGKQHTGQLAGWSSEALQVRTETELVSIPADQIAKVSQSTSPPQQEFPYLVTLLDGSEVYAEQLEANNKSFTVWTMHGRWDWDVRQVRHVRMRPASPALDGQWQELVGGELVSDVLVIHKSDEVLVKLAGVIEGVDEKNIRFQFGDNVLDVDRGKLEGFAFFANVQSNHAEPLCRVHAVDGSVWNGRDVQYNDGVLQLTTVADLDFEIPFPGVSSVTFADGRMVYLSDLEPVVTTITPKVASAVQGPLLDFIYRPRQDESMLGDRLRLQYQSGSRRVEEFEKGLAVHSKTELVWRLDGQYRRLESTVGIDSRLGKRGNVRLTIAADGRPIYDEDIIGGDDPKDVDLDINGTRRLSITVDYGDDIDVADHLNLCNLKVTQ